MLMISKQLGMRGPRNHWDSMDLYATASISFLSYIRISAADAHSDSQSLYDSQSTILNLRM